MIKKLIWIMIILLAVTLYMFPGNGKIGENSGHTDKIFKLGVGATLYGDGDITGYMIFNEFFKKLSSRFAYSLRLSYLFGNNESTLSVYPELNPQAKKYNQISQTAFDVEFNLAPFRFKKHTFYIGVGGSLRYYYDTYTMPDYTYQPNFAYVTDPDGWNSYYYDIDCEQSKAINLGYIISLNYSIKTSRKMVLGLRMAFQSYRGSTVAFIGINYGFGF